MFQRIHRRLVPLAAALAVVFSAAADAAQRVAPKKYSTGFLTASSTNLAAGVQNIASLSPATYPRFPLNDATAVIVTPFVSAGTTAKGYRLWGAVQFVDSSGNVTGQGELFLLGSGTATAGTGTGSSGMPIGATDLVCHTITYTETSEATTPKGPVDDFISARNGAPSTVYSPGDNTAGKIYAYNLGGAQFLILEPVSGTGGLNAMIEALNW